MKSGLGLGSSDPMILRDERSIAEIARYEFIINSPNPKSNIMKINARNNVLTLLITLSAVALSAKASATVLFSGDFNGTYTSVTYTSLSFTPTAGNKYGISATINASPFTTVGNGEDQTGNATYIGFGTTLTFDGNSKALGSMVNNYAWGTEWLFVNPVNDTGSGTGKPGNLEVGTTTVANPYGPINVGLLLDTTGATWSLSYYVGGTGFNDTAVHQGGSLLGTVTGIDPTKVNNGIHFTYLPVIASGSEAQSVVSNFRVVDSVPESSSFALVVGGIANLLLIRRRVRA